MNITDIEAAGLAVLHLLTDYSNPPQREMAMDPVLYGYFEGRFGQMSRQKHVHLHGGKRPARIDFRRGTSNPLVLEFAVRCPAGRGNLRGYANQSELRKLTRVPQSQARRRVLLLLDLAPTPFEKEALKASYDAVHAGPGKFKRHSVRVVYAHKDDQYNFLWDPFRAT